MSDQLALFDLEHPAGECFAPGCSKAPTHAACGFIPALHLDGTPNTRAGSARVECCLWHANYYASAWCPIYPLMTDSAWIEVLSIAPLLSAT